MMQKNSFLLIGNLCESYWHQTLKEALSNIGSLEIQSEESSLSLVLKKNFSLIIVDAGGVYNPSCLVSRIREVQPDARIVVMTASPTWKQAREMFYAGVTDYMRKLPNKDELLPSFQEVLRKPVRYNRK